MDGFTLASHIAACAEETITYKSIPIFLIGPYFPHETLSIREFTSFKLPPVQTRIKNPSSCLSSKPPSMNILSEDDVRSVGHPSPLNMKKLIAKFDVDDESLLTSVEIGSCHVPTIILEIWRIHLRLWDLQNLWKDMLRQAGNLAMRCHSQRSAIKAALQRLASCQWNEEIQGFSSIGRSGVGVLMRYLSNSCLVTTDIIHHIEILQSNVEMTNLMAQLMSPLETQHLAACASQGNTALGTYKHLPTYKGLRHLGSELISGVITHCGGVLHVNQNHWISFIISSEDAIIYLADSLHASPSKATAEAMGIIQWWLNVSYLGSNKPAISF
jgi:hypothetical protein